MSKRQQEQEFVDISIKNAKPMDIVKKVLEENFGYFRKQIKSQSSYRKVHEILSTILDTAEGLNDAEALKFLREQLPRAYIIIEYQNVREQISDNLRELLVKLINDLASANESNVKELIKNARLLIDSLAVIAKTVK